MRQLSSQQVDRLSRQLREADPAAQLGEAQVAFIADRIRQASSSRRTARGAKKTLALMALFGAPLAFATVAYWAKRDHPAPASLVVQPALVQPHPVPEPVLPEPEVLPAPVVEAPAAPVRSAPRPVPAVDPVVVVPPVPRHSLLDETRLLQQALSALKGARASEALASLDQYRAQFPQGILAQEERLARLDVLLALKRTHAALGLLEELAAQSDVPRRDELGVLRAELLAQSGRCAEAEGLFGQALHPALTEELEGRALYGRASCLLQLGRSAAGQAQMQRYLDRFPTGRFAEHARAALNP